MSTLRKRQDAKAVNTVVTIKRLDEEQRIVYGEVYAPFQVDTYGEFMRLEDVQAIAHRFLADLDLKSVIDTNHDNVPNGSYPVESFIARDNDPDFTPGAWVLGVKVPSDATWAAVKSGDLNGFSLEALVKPQDYTVELLSVRDAIGRTADTNDHAHTYFIMRDNLGRVVAGVTDAGPDGHTHTISRGTKTDEADGHSHRLPV